MSKKILIQLDEKQVEIAKLPIGGYVDLIRAIKKLPAHIVKIKDLDKDAIIAMIPELAEAALPDLIGVIAAGVRMPVDEIEQLGLMEIIQLVEAFLTVNRIDEVIATVKKVMALPAIQEYARKTEEQKTAPSTT